MLRRDLCNGMHEDNVSPSITCNYFVQNNSIREQQFLNRRPNSLELTAWFVAWSSRRVRTFMRDLKTHLFTGH